MISKLLQLYRWKQWKSLQKEFHNNATLGEMTEVGSKAFIRNESKDKSRINVGHHSRIDGYIYCKSSGKIEIGNYSTIQDEVQLQCLEHIKIGHYSVVAGGSVIMDNNNHRIEPEERVKHRIRAAPGGSGYPGLGDGYELSDSAPIIIEDVVWIGARCVILKGVTVGEGALVARNAVVTKDVPPYTIVAGNPARVVKQIEKPDYKYYEI